MLEVDGDDDDDDLLSTIAVAAACRAVLRRRKAASEGRNRKRRRKGRKQRIMSNRDCEFYKQYTALEAKVGDERFLSDEAEEFRKTFVLPFPVFCDILSELQEDGHFKAEDKNVDAAKRRGVPLATKLMGALLHLARGDCFHNIAPRVGCDMETLRVFALKFYLVMSTRYVPFP